VKGINPGRRFFCNLQPTTCHLSDCSVLSSENVPQPFQVAGTSKRTHFDFAATWKGCGTLRAALFIVSGRRNATSMTLFLSCEQKDVIKKMEENLTFVRQRGCNENLIAGFAGEFLHQELMSLFRAFYETGRRND
jgi:hypothetical protein